MRGSGTCPSKTEERVREGERERERERMREHYVEDDDGN
jgi:hypothetical protein